MKLLTVLTVVAGVKVVTVVTVVIIITAVTEVTKLIATTIFVTKEKENCVKKVLKKVFF